MTPAHAQGKITDDALVQSIEFSEIEAELGYDVSYKIFADILQKLHFDDRPLGFNDKRINYQYISGLGVIYQLDFGYSIRQVRGTAIGISQGNRPVIVSQFPYTISNDNSG